MKVLSEKRPLKWDMDSVKNYINQFDTLDEFYKDPEYSSISRWVGNMKTKTGDSIFSMKKILSDLREKEDKKITEELKQKFPQFNFENVVYGRTEDSYKTIKGITCEKTDSEGVVHGEIDETRLSNLTPYSCKKCYSEHKEKRFPQAKEGKIDKFKERIPNDLPLNFEDAEFDLISRSEGSDQTRLVVKNIKCVSKNHEGNPVNLFPQWTRTDSIQDFEFLCPVCNNRKVGDSKGEAKTMNLLQSLGYDPIKNKRLGAYSIKGTGHRNRLKADAYFVKEDGTIVIAEFDGEQHFFPKAKFGGLQGFEETVQNDTAKNKFCLENGIKLIRISFNDFRNIESELANALSIEPMKDIYLSKNYPPLGWNDPKLQPVQIQLDELNIRKDYVFTESQLQRILEGAEEEKINRLIKKYILSNFDDVKEINFHSQMEAQSPTSPTPYLEKKAIEILFDRSQLTFIEMLHTKFEIQQALDNYFDLKTYGRGTNWEVIMSAE